MGARAALPTLAETALTTLFERTINETRLFWSQNEDGTACCPDWEWCCPEIPAVLAGLDAVVFVTEDAPSARFATNELIVITLDARRLWGKWSPLGRAPRDGRAVTWDDRAVVDL